MKKRGVLGIEIDSPIHIIFHSRNDLSIEVLTLQVNLLSITSKVYYVAPRSYFTVHRIFWYNRNNDVVCEKRHLIPTNFHAYISSD